MGNMGNILHCCCMDREGKVQKDGIVVHENMYSKAEERIWAKVDSVFNTYDINMNSKLSYKEMKKYLQELTRSSSEEKLKETFETMDTDGDGEVSASELFDYLMLKEGKPPLKHTQGLFRLRV